MTPATASTRLDRGRMEVIAMVTLGSALGGMARYGLSGLIAGRIGATFPWGTMAVNVLGSLAIGLLLGGIGAPIAIEAPPRLQLATYGVLGGFTTFSTLSLETLNLVREGELVLAGAYVGGTLLLGIAAVAAGFLLASG